MTKANTGRPVDIDLLSRRFSGANFKKLLKSKNVTKYRIMKDTGISYQTLCRWQSGRAYPSEALTIIVGKYLGLIEPDGDMIMKLEHDLEKIKSMLDRYRLKGVQSGKDKGNKQAKADDSGADEPAVPDEA